jgi:hypothetical protein
MALFHLQTATLRRQMLMLHLRSATIHLQKAKLRLQRFLPRLTMDLKD